MPSVHRHVLQRRPWRAIVINKGDSYATIAEKNKVSANGVISLNSLGQKCEDLRQGRTICLPENCALHKISKIDDYKSIASKYKTTKYLLLAWNPMLDPKCTNINDYVGWHACVS